MYLAKVYVNFHLQLEFQLKYNVYLESNKYIDIFESIHDLKLN